MTRRSTRRGVLAGGATAIATALAGCSAVTPFVGRRNERTERIPLDGAGTLAVFGSVGDVTVRPGDRDDVRAEIVEQSSSASVDLSNLHLRADRTDGRLELRREWTGDTPLLGGEPSMDLDLTVPSALALERIDTSVGDVTVRGLSGDLAADTSTGEVTVEGLDGNVDADTSTGDVEVTDVDGTVAADTSTGSVRVRDAARLGDVSTSTGDVDVEIRALEGDTTISTSTGRVDAAVAADLDAALRVSTSVGSVTVEGLDFRDETRTDDSLVGTIGAGGPRLSIETSTGDVTVTLLE